MTLLSLDESFPLDALAILAASSALSVSDIPFNTHVSAAIVADVNGS